MKPEAEKELSNQGFDTKLKVFIIAFVSLVLISFTLGATGTGLKIQKAILDSIGYSGEVRNCIASALGSPPDCAPNSKGQCLPTIINGHVPECGTLDGSSCRDVKVNGAVYNPYRWCYSMTSNNVCIPC